MSRKSWTLGLGCLGAALSLLLLLRTVAPPAPARVLSADPAYYLAMARTPFAESSHARSAPFAWRILVPGAVYLTGLPPKRGFEILTLGSLAVLPLAVFWLLSGLRIRRRSAAWAAAAGLLAPALTGYAAWDYIRVDAPALLLTTAAAGAFVRRRHGLFLLLMVAAALTKETVLVPASFALAYSLARRDPFLLRVSVVAFVMAVFLLVGLRVALPAAGPTPVEAMSEMYWPFDPRTVLRRVLLATAATWTVLLPIAAYGVATMIRRGEGRLAATLLTPMLVSSAQILVAFDTQRVVVAALPFLLALAASGVDQVRPDRVGGAVVWGTLSVAQLPWVLQYSRIVDFWWLRGLEVGLVLLASGAAVAGLRRRSP